MKNIIKKADELSNNAIMLFISKLNISSHEMTFLNDIPIKVETTDEAIAKYESIENEIIYSKEELEKSRIRILKATSSHEIIDEVTEVSNSLTHEKIHACRTVITPQNKLHRTDYLDYIIDGNISVFTKESNDINEKLPLVICDIDYDLELNELQNFIKNEENFEQRKLDNIVNERIHRLNQQEALEESITEALATLISLNSRAEFNSYSLEDLTEFIINKSKKDFVKAGAKIINAMGNNMIEWFLTTKNQTEYNNLFKETFSDKYPELLDIMLKMNESSPKQIERLDSIINEKIYFNENTKKEK